MKATSVEWAEGKSHAARLLKDDNLVIAHNLVFDVMHLRAAGIPVRGPFWCTMIGNQTVDPDAPDNSLNGVASFWLTMKRWKHKGSPKTRPRLGKMKTWKRAFLCSACGQQAFEGRGVKADRECLFCVRAKHQVAVKAWIGEGIKYNRTDSAVLLPIQQAQRAELITTGQLALFERMMRVLERVLIPMMERGLLVDPQARDKIAAHFNRVATRALRRFDRMAPSVNPGSPPQLATLMYDTLGLPKLKGRSTDVEVLREQIKRAGASPTSRLLGTVLAYRRATKWGATYAAIGDKIYPRYTPSGKDDDKSGGKGRPVAATGRLLAKGDRRTNTPPVGNTPKRMRDLVVPHKGFGFVGTDYDSQELRLLAAHSQDTHLLAQIAAGDIHDENAAEWGIDRTRAKNLFYGGISYGGGPRAIQHALRAKGYAISLNEANGFIKKARQTYPGIFAWHKQVIEAAEKRGYVENSFGRRRPISNVKASYNIVINFPIQADGSDMFWHRIEAMWECARIHEGWLVLPQHDGFLFEIPLPNIPAFCEAIRIVMELPFPQICGGFSCPIKIKTGQNWKAAS